MAALVITSVTADDVDADGWPVEVTTSTYILYCDRCGSFHVGPYPALAQCVFLLLWVFPGTWLWYYLGTGLVAGMAWIPWWVVFAFLVAVSFREALNWHGHRCLDCGHRQITFEDVLDYGSRPEEADAHLVEGRHTHNGPAEQWYQRLALIPIFLVVFAGVCLMPLVIAVLLTAALISSAVKDTLGRLRLPRSHG